jgi:hypothetical protein
MSGVVSLRAINADRPSAAGATSAGEQREGSKGGRAAR